MALIDSHVTKDSSEPHWTARELYNFYLTWADTEQPHGPRLTYAGFMERLQGRDMRELWRKSDMALEARQPAEACHQ
jgi:hypothetical protein